MWLRKISGESRTRDNVDRGGRRNIGRTCVAEDRWVFGITSDWSTAALDPGVWHIIDCEEGYRFMAAWVREDENASETRQRKKEADKVEVAPEVTVESLRRFRVALIGPTRRLPKRRRLRQQEIRRSWRRGRGWRYAKPSQASVF